MKAQKVKKENTRKKTPNLKKRILIKVALVERNITLTQIANDLDITLPAVSRAISGLSTISRVDEWCEKNLGIKL
jgi:predicted transcriptional regulator